MTSVQKFPLPYHSISNIIWEDDNGKVQTSKNESYPIGDQCEAIVKRNPDSELATAVTSALNEYKKLLDGFMHTAYLRCLEKAPHKVGDTLTLKSPYSRMDKVKIEKVACQLYDGKAYCAYIGRMIKKNGELTEYQVICFSYDIKDEDNHG